MVHAGKNLLAKEAEMLHSPAGKEGQSDSVYVQFDELLKPRGDVLRGSRDGDGRREIVADRLLMRRADGEVLGEVIPLGRPRDVLPVGVEGGDSHVASQRALVDAQDRAPSSAAPLSSSTESVSHRSMKTSAGFRPASEAPRRTCSIC